MPKEKPYYINIDKLLKHDAIDKFMFAYVTGMRRALPGNHLNKCIEMFKDEFLLSEDNYPLESALQTYYRMLKSYRVYRKTQLGLDK